MAEFDVEKAREICEKATPGPWKIITEDVGDEYIIISPTTIRAGEYTVISSEGGLTHFDGEWKLDRIEADSNFIAASRELLPAAIGEIERLRAEADNWQCEYPCSEEKWCNRQNLCNRMKELYSKNAEQVTEIERLRTENKKQEQGISNLQTALVIRDQINSEKAKRIEKLESEIAKLRQELTGASTGMASFVATPLENKMIWHDVDLERANERIEVLQAALKDALTSLERAECQFFACDGPDAPFVDMKTCHRCHAIMQIREVLQ